MSHDEDELDSFVWVDISDDIEDERESNKVVDVCGIENRENESQGNEKNELDLGQDLELYSRTVFHEVDWEDNENSDLINPIAFFDRIR